jgi:hypothetical protein
MHHQHHGQHESAPDAHQAPKAPLLLRLVAQLMVILDLDDVRRRRSPGARPRVRRSRPQAR